MIEIGDKVEFVEGTIIYCKGVFEVVGATDSQYILDNGWKIQKDWLKKVVL